MIPKYSILMAGLKQLKLRWSMKLAQYYQSLKRKTVRWWLLLQNSLQYSDGRVEVVDVPKAFSVGEVVAVTHRRDGGVVVQRVSPVPTPIDGDLFIYLGDVTTGQTLGYTLYIKKHIPGSQTIYVTFYTYVFESGSGASTSVQKRYSSSADWGAETIANYTSIKTGEAYLRIENTAGMVSGDYIRIDLIKHNGSYNTGNLITDGSFESNILNTGVEVIPGTAIPKYGDKNTNWIKNKGGRVRIISSDYYDGSYCLEFYT